MGEIVWSKSVDDIFNNINTALHACTSLIEDTMDCESVDIANLLEVHKHLFTSATELGIFTRKNGINTESKVSAYEGVLDELIRLLSLLE